MPVRPAYPTGGQYQEALQNPTVCFKDSALAGGKPTVDRLGLPKPISGNFASVFMIAGADGKRWAIKCFTRYVADQEFRYQKISEILSGLSKPWQVSFDYIPEGILCRGTWYPILKMEWIEAKGLISFIEENLWQPEILARLAEKFAKMISDLSHLQIAHGDLQHGNLLVTPGGGLKLIDYDGMYVPGLNHLGASENGHANYQSPARSMNSWGSNLDYFSSWVIYCSLVALTIDPTLWIQFHNEGDESLLFCKDDFIDLKSSGPLVVLSQSKDQRLKDLSRVLASFWTNDLSNIPPLDAKAVAAPSIPPLAIKPHSFSTHPTTGEHDLFKSVSDWRSSIDTSSLSVAEAANDPSWVLNHMPPSEDIPFEPVNRVLRALALIVLLLVAGVSILGTISLLPKIDAAVGVAALVGVMLVTSGISFRRTQESRAKQASRTWCKDRQGAASTARRLASQLEKDRRALDQRERQALEKIGKRASKARESEQREFQATERRLADRLSSIGSQTQALQSAETAEIGKTLRVLQDQYLVNQLMGASIRSASIPGIGHALKGILAASGVTTAADFIGIARSADGEVFIKLRNGQLVHPSGIGEVKARVLDQWRLEVESRARRAQPGSLPPAQVQAIRLKYAQQRQSLVLQERNVRVEAVMQQNEIRERWRGSYVAISSELAEVRERFLSEREQAEVRLSNARREARDMAWQQVRAMRELGAYREVTYLSYCARVLRGS